MKPTFPTGRALVITLVGGLAGLLSCSSTSPPIEHACTDIGCGLPFEVVFQAGTPWTAGIYTIDVIADGVEGSCNVVLPLSCDRSSVCTGSRTWVAEESGCALPAAQQSIAGISFNDTTPTAVAVKVISGGRVMGAGTYAPAYTTSQPNGTGCGPTCKTATHATLTLE